MTSSPEAAAPVQETAAVDYEALIERLEGLRAKATPGPYRAHDHNDMRQFGEDVEKWIGYAWVGRVVKGSTPDGRFDSGWLDRDSRDDASKPYRERASADVHYVAEALNALPVLTTAIRDLLARVETLELAVEPLTVIYGVNMNDPLKKWLTMAQLQAAVDALRARHLTQGETDDA